MPLPLDGPRDLPSGRAEQLVVLCHGFGTNGEDMIALSPHWRPLLPRAAFVSPNGPEDRGGDIAGYRWFAVSEFVPEQMLKSAAVAAATLDGFIDQELEGLDLPPERLALVGFSQGAMMALQVGLRRKTAPAAIVAWCGPLASTENMPPGPAPPVLLIAGDADPQMTVDVTLQAAERLAAAGVPTRSHIASGVGHTIDPNSRLVAGEFLRAAFAGELDVS